jgi:hypothetical protein
MKQWYQIVTDENGKMYLQTEDYSLASELSNWDYLYKYHNENGIGSFLFELYNNDDEPVQIMNKIIKWRLEEPTKMTDFDYENIDNIVSDLRFLMTKVFPKELNVICYDYSCRMDIKIVLMDDDGENYKIQRAYELQPYTYNELERRIKDTCNTYVTRIKL